MPRQVIIEVEVIWHGGMAREWGRGSLLNDYQPSQEDPRWGVLFAACDPRKIDTRAFRVALSRCRRPGRRHPWRDQAPFP